MANSQTRNAEDFAANTQGRKKSRGRKPLANDAAQRGRKKPLARNPEDFREEAEAEPGELDER